jgi:hypothetical protein
MTTRRRIIWLLLQAGGSHVFGESLPVLKLEHPAHD